MESGWNVWVWLVGAVSRRQVWIVGVGGIYGCGCKEVYRFPHMTYPYILLLYLFFLQQHLGLRALFGNFFGNNRCAYKKRIIKE